MKRMLSGIIAVAALVLVSATTVAAQEMTTAEAIAKVSEDPAMRDFIFNPTIATTSRGTEFNLVMPYYLRVKGNRIDSYLPYAGASFPGGSASLNMYGLDFDGTVSKFKVFNQKRGVTYVNFNVTSDMGDNYTFALWIQKDGSTEMKVIPLTQNFMMFSGSLSTDLSSYTRDFQ